MTESWSRFAGDAGAARAWLLRLVVLGMFSVGVAEARVLTNGVLRVEIGSNGAIHSANYKGVEYFRIGWYVSDFGFQEGTAEETFRSFTATGLAPFPLAVGENRGRVEVAGSFSIGTVPIQFAQEYSLVPGKNILRVAVRIKNLAESGKSLRYFATFDPDQGTVGTYLDREIVGGLNAATARTSVTGSENSLILGSTDARTVVSAGRDFIIHRGLVLNNIVINPSDRNGRLADEGIHIVLPLEFAGGQETEFVYFLGFGDNLTQVRSGFAEVASTALAFASFPPDQVVNAGETKTFSATTNLTDGVLYQWSKDGVLLEGQTAATLTLGPLGPDDAGRYTLAAALGGQFVTRAFELGINTPPTITAAVSSLVIDEDHVGTVGLIVGDVEQAAAGLVVKVESVSGAGLLSLGGVTLSGTGPTRTLRVVPLPNANGSGVVRVSVRDGFATTVLDVPVTVTPVNDAPTSELSTGSVMVTLGGSVEVPFVVGDIDTSLDALTIDVVPVNAGILPPGAAVVTGTGAARTLRLTPAMAGQTAVSVIVGDGEWTNEKVVVLNVRQAPVFTEDPEGGNFATGAVVTLTAAAAGFPVATTWTWYRDGVLVPGANSSTLVVTPSVPGSSGTYVARATNTVGSTDSAPAVVGIYDRVQIGMVTTPQALDETSGVRLAPTVTGSAPVSLQWWKDGSMLPGETAATLLFSNVTPAAAGTYQLRGSNPVSNVEGNEIVVTVNGAPTVALDATDLTFPEDTVGGPVTVTLGDPETAPEDLTVVVESGNPGLLPSSGLVLAGSGAVRELTISPAADKSGISFVRVRVSDGRINREAILRVTVTPVDDPIVVEGLTAQVLDEDAEVTATFSFSDVEIPSGPYVVTVESDSPELLPTGAMVLGGTGFERTLRLVPVADAFGEATVTVTVTDGARSTSSTFPVTVRPVNDAPFFVTVPDSPVIGEAGQVLGPLAVSIGDIDDPLDALELTATAADGVLVAGVAVGGADGVRTVTLTPGNGRSGETTILLAVTDGEATATAQFGVEIRRGAFFEVEPEGQDVETGEEVTLSVVAGGYPVPAIQWLKDGDDLPGQNGTTLALGAVGLEATGSYAVRLNNLGVDVTSGDAVLRVFDPVSIAEDPEDVVAPVDGVAEFTVTPAGTGPFSYLWSKDGNPLPEETEQTLRISPLSYANSGAYTVRVSNPVSHATSEPAQLDVQDPPTITLDPLPLTRAAETQARFTAAASGSETLNYQWFKGTGEIPGATEATLVLDGLTLGSAGNYSVRVRNSVGEARSAEAALTVVPAVATEWDWTNPSPVGTALRTVAYNPSSPGARWVAAGDGNLLYSVDGREWEVVDLQEVTSGRTAVYRVAAVGTGFKLISSAGVLESTDGVAWMLAASDLALQPSGAAVGPSGRVVAFSSFGVAYSDDWLTWLPGRVDLSGETQTGFNPFPRSFSGQDGSRVYEYSISFPFTGRATGLTVELDLEYVGYSNFRVTLVGPDGVEVDIISGLAAGDFERARFRDGADAAPAAGAGPYDEVYLPAEALAALNNKEYSDSGWMIRISTGFPDDSFGFGSNGVIRGVAVRAAGGFDNFFMAGGLAFSDGFEASATTVSYSGDTRNYVIRSTNGVEWTNQTPAEYGFGPSTGFSSAEGNGLRARVWFSGLGRSTNGLNWTDVTLPQVQTPSGARYPVATAVTFYGGQFYVAAGTNSELNDAFFFRSPDLVNWTALTPAAVEGRNRVTDLVSGGGRLVAAGLSPTLLSSSDGSEWESAIASVVQHTGTIFGTPDGTLWLANNAVPVTEHIFRSTDGGETWQGASVEAGFTSAYVLSSVAQGPAGTVVHAGSRNAFHTVDGETYTKLTALGTSIHWVASDGERFRLERNTGSGIERMVSLDGLDWTSEGIRSGQSLSEVISHGGYLFGRSGTRVFRSVDGRVWREVLNTTDVGLTRLVSGGGRLLAQGISGFAGRTFVSSDLGTTWTPATLNPPHSVGSFGVTWGYDQFVAVASTNPLINSVLTSPDGVTWTLRAGSLPSAPTLRGIAYSPNAFVIVGDNGTVLRSESMVAPGPELLEAPPTPELVAGQEFRWTPQVLGGGAGMTFEWYRDGELLSGVGPGLVLPAVSGADAGNYRLVVTDAEGRSTEVTFALGVREDFPTNWTSLAVPDVSWDRVIHDGERFVARGTRSVAVSADGLSWETRIAPPLGSGLQPTWMASGGDRILMGGWRFVGWSDDGGQTWESALAESQGANGLNGVVYHGAEFVGVGPSGTVRRSADGLDWTPATSGTANALYDVATDGTQLVAVGDGGTILTSTDGVTWVPRTSGVTAGLRGVAHANGTWVVCGSAASYAEGFVTTVLVSADGVTWTRRPMTGIGFQAFKVAGGPAGFTITHGGGNASVLVGDAAGANWQTVALDGGSFARAVAVGGGATVVAGTEGGIFRNAGSLTSAWSRRVPVTTMTAAQGAVWFGDRFYAAFLYRTGAQTGSKLMSSVDGETWTLRHDFGLNRFVYALAVDGANLLVGETGMISRSTDGVTWTPATMPPNVPTVTSIERLGDALYAVAGTRVLRSLNGAAWTEVLNLAGLTDVRVAGVGNRILASGWESVSNGFSWTDEGRLWISTDGGVSFAEATTTFDERLYDLHQFGDEFIATTSTGLHRSPDGVAWSLAEGSESLAYVMLRDYDGMLAALRGSQIAFSPDGVFWTSVVAPSATQLAVGPGRVVVSGADGVASASRNSVSVALRLTQSEGGQDLSYPFGRTLAAVGQRLSWTMNPLSQYRVARWLVDGVEAQVGGLNFEPVVTAGMAEVAVELERIPQAPSVPSVVPTGVPTEGSSFVLTASATGFPAPTWQWRKDGVDLPGETAATLTFEPVSRADNGTYTVVATNSSGFAPSAGYQLDARFAPEIQAQPRGGALAIGANVTLSVAATGNPASLNYQWFRDGEALTGRTAATLPFTHFLPRDEGAYSVRVTNTAGQTMSADARLFVGSGSDVQPAPGGLVQDFRPSVTRGGVTNVFRLPDGRLLAYATGLTTVANDAGQKTLAVLNADGTVDASFDPGATVSGTPDFLAMPDGGILLYGDVTATLPDGAIIRNLVRLTPELTVDPDFAAMRTANDQVYTAAFDVDPVSGVSRLWVGGSFTSSQDGNYTTSSRQRLVRLKRAGSGGTWIFDTTFSSFAGANNGVYTITPQSGGGAYISGWFTSVNSTSRRYIARITNNGSLDTGFVPPTTYSAVPGVNGITRVHQQADGKLVCTGNFNAPSGDLRYAYIQRLTSTGALDQSWDISTGFNSSHIWAILPQADGRLIFAGGFSSYDSVVVPGIVRVLADGAIDPDFAAPEFRKASGPGGVLRVISLPDNELLVTGDFVQVGLAGADGVARLGADGALIEGLVPGTATTGSVSVVVPVAGGGAFVGGNLTRFNGLPVPGFALLDGAGALVEGFDRSGALTGTILCAARETGGSWIVGGSFTNIKGVAKRNVARILADGTVDLDFNPGGTGPDGAVNAVGLDADGRIVIGGAFTQVNDVSRPRIARLEATGSLDSTFDPGTGFNAAVQDLEVLTDGAIIAAGTFTQYRSVSRVGLAWVQNTGALDATINKSINGAVSAIARGPSGELFAGGSFTQVGLTSVGRVVRFDEAGNFDGAYQSPDTWTVASGALDVQVDGRVVFVGAGAVRRLTPQGVVDPEFNAGTQGSSVTTAAVATDGGIFVGGSFNSFNGIARGALVKLDGGMVPAAPELLAPPESLLVLAGQPASLVVLASGFPEPTYRWFKDGGVESVGSGPVLEVVSAGPGDVGSYTVEVSNTFGSFVAGPAEIALNTRPDISSIPTQTTAVSLPAGPIPFTVNDGETAAEDLVVTVLSSNQALLPNANITLSGAAGNRSLTLTPVAEMTGTAFVTVLVSDGTLSSARVFGLTVRPGETLWLSESFSPAQQLEPEISGPTANPDGDGMDNFLEYALGDDPLSGDTPKIPEVTPTEETAVFRYTRPAAATDVNYNVRCSGDLAVWMSLGEGERVSSVDGLETWEVEIPMDGDGCTFFLLQVSRK